MDATQAPGQDEQVPRLRGLLHVVACPLAIAAGGAMAWLAPTPRAALAIVLMAGGYAVTFGISGIYHRGRWTPRARRRVRQLDHATIFLAMAMTYSALWLVVLEGVLADALLVFCWLALPLGVAAKLRYIDARTSRHWIAYVAVGLLGLLVLPDVWRAMGSTGASLMLGGGLACAIGSVAYLLRRPNPFPSLVGHHELFHAGTVVCAALQLTALGTFAVR